MRIPFTEPTAPRYITINQATNQVHLMVPVVGGQEISTDNTCKSKLALREFFDGGALYQLNTYKKALVFDIQLLEEDHPQRALKEARLAQISAYIEAVKAMRYSYAHAMAAFLERPSNLYTIQLRPREQDSYSRVVSPAFNIERGNDAHGKPLSALYNAMQAVYPGIRIGQPDPRAIIISAVINTLPPSPIFTDIQQVLGEQCLRLYGLNIDFTQNAQGTLVDKAYIDTIRCFDETNPATPEEYIDSLLLACALNLSMSISSLPFYSIPQETPTDRRVEGLSILTQFFLANVNIYCRAKKISTQNFGRIFDVSPALSNELVAVVATALTAGNDVETLLCTFCNKYTTKLRLSEALNTKDIIAIKQQFERTYKMVTATKENPHMDDFMIVDLKATGESAKFVTHQGSICTNFAEIVEPVLANQDYFACVRADFAGHLTEIPHKNEWIAGVVNIEPEALLARITDEQFEKLPDVVKVVCRAHPAFQMRQFLSGVAKGCQTQVEALLMTSPAKEQYLLRTPGVFMDYSGRTFNCTGYEYAYWAKDTHMCRMLEGHMDEETKAQILARVDKIYSLDAGRGKPMGLLYQQGGIKHRSAHFDLTPLIDALQRYVAGYDTWKNTGNWAVVRAAWMEVGVLQRDMPAHVVNEYCHPERSFSQKPAFNEKTLPRNLEFYNSERREDQSFFPLVICDSSGLGIDFALIRGRSNCYGLGVSVGAPCAGEFDLFALRRLDEIRTIELRHLRKSLLPTEVTRKLVYYFC